MFIVRSYIMMSDPLEEQSVIGANTSPDYELTDSDSLVL